jgi:hypothetical protein
MGMSPQDYEYLLVAANLAHFHQKRGFSINVSKWKLFLEGHQFETTNCMGTVEVDTKKLDLNACINGVSPKHKEQVSSFGLVFSLSILPEKLRCRKIVTIE